MLAILLLPALACVLAIPTPVNEARAVAPSVTIRNGTVVGSTSLDGVDSFKGIPFAQPPTGSLRLKPPQPITTPFGTIQAIANAPSCPQFFLSYDNSSLPSEALNLLLDDPIVQAATGASEDCLTLSVQRPSNINSSSLLPVVFYIYGGGFELGGTSMYDASTLISRSVSLGAPVIYVAVSYRLAGFGFLAGRELQQDGSTNLGLRDQRLGLQWVAENIREFGGDPDRVTIWGESAGSISVYDHLFINNGDNTYNGKPLFISAVMDSGSALPTLPVDSEPAQNVYDTVVDTAGCNTAADSLECLRGLSYEEFLEASTSVPEIFSHRSLDLSYLPRYDPHDAFFPVNPGAAGKAGTSMARVPFIIGDQEDEGPLFSLVLSNVTTEDDVVDYFTSYYPEASRAQIQGLVDTYPTDPAAGSPFNTGILNEIYPGFKRNAAILGDLYFTLTRRAVLSYANAAAPDVPQWSYLSSYFYGTPVLGTFHASDLLLLYENFPSPIPSESIFQYYISFFNHLDPNALGTAAPLIEWPQWTAQNLTLLNFQAAANQLIQDDFRQQSYEYLLGIQDVLLN